jgi:hypothetical protein
MFSTAGDEKSDNYENYITDGATLQQNPSGQIREEQESGGSECH